MTREFPKNPPEKIELPTVGRIVLVKRRDGKAPDMAAIIAAVNVLSADPLAINVGCFNSDGTTGPLQYLKHVSHPDWTDEHAWDWMPYQKGQARKAEELEAKLKEATITDPGMTNGTSEVSKLQASAPSPEDGKR